MTMKFFISTIIIILLSSNIKSDSVCSAQALITELNQDIADNGKLDCLRKPLPPPRDKPETPQEKKRRLDAAWDSDCAFEADYDWLKIASDRFGMRTGLVDRDGKAVENPFDHQADMCELIRAMTIAGLFEGVKLDALTEDSYSGLECVGPQDQELQICAASGGSAAQKYSWTILLEPSHMVIKENGSIPRFTLDPKSRKKIEARKSLAN